ncbi:MAG: hypothetical protein Q4E57_06745 [Eubacteriales bacterium]|nr:hypothetical protein [Eubacteriales bacterium]
MLDLLKEYFHVHDEVDSYALNNDAVNSAQFMDLYFRMSSGC